MPVDTFPLTTEWLYALRYGRLLKPYPEVDVWYPDDTWSRVYRTDERRRLSNGIPSIFA